VHPRGIHKKCWDMFEVCAGSPAEAAGLLRDSLDIRGHLKNLYRNPCIPAEYTKNVALSTNILLEVQQKPRTSQRVPLEIRGHPKSPYRNPCIPAEYARNVGICSRCVLEVQQKSRNTQEMLGNVQGMCWNSSGSRGIAKRLFGDPRKSKESL
jgi:hypothetical protein